MPNGPTHTKTTFYCSIVLPPATYIMGGSLQDSFMMLCGCAAGLVVTPDLDVDFGSYSMFIIKIIGGEFASRVWVKIWYPYSKIIPHRSPWSHFPIFSTILRVVYFSAIFLLPFWLLAGMRQENNLYVFIPFFIGMFVVDSLHIFMDFTTTKIKKWRRKLWLR